MNKIFNDNAIAIMDRMIAKEYKVDLVVTDPPYPTTARGCAGNSGGMLQKDINKKGKVFENNDTHVKVWGDKLIYKFENGKYHLVKDERLSSVISLSECTSNNPQSYINDDNNWK